MIKKSKSLPLFYRIYFSILFVFVILLIIGTVLLSHAISSYNKGIAETVSAEFFTNTFLNTDAEKILAMSGTVPSEFETESDLKKFISDSLDENLTYTSISADGEDKNYIVKSGEYKVASFTLSADEKGDYFPSGLDLHFSAENKVRVKLLSNSTLYINGIAVSEKYISERNDHSSASYMPDGVEKKEWITYTVENLCTVPTISAIDRNGKKISLSEDENGILTEQIIYDEPDEEIVQRVLSGAKQYAICMQQDASKASVYPYFEKGTDLYNGIRTVENFFVWEHDGYRILNENVTEYMRYDENTVSMRVYFEHVLKKHGHQDYIDIADVTYYARNIDGKYMIFARHNNN